MGEHQEPAPTSPPGASSGADRPVRVLLVDDDPMVCRGLELLLSAAPDVTVVAAVHDGDEVIDAVHAHHPDVVLMDVRMRRVDGITATQQLQRLAAPPRVVVLTTFDDDEAVLRAVKVGAAGFLLKTASPEEILTALRGVAAGEAAISPRSARALFEHVAADPHAAVRHDALGAMGALTDRERQIVVAVGQGLSNSQIASRLHLGEPTVKTHLSNAMTKLGYGSRVEVAVLAAQAGLLAD